jgi:hypothetical protein
VPEISVIFLITIGLLIFGIFDVIGCDASEVRNLPKLVWLLLVVVVAPIGTIAWLFLGRPQRDSTSAPRVARASGVSSTIRRAARREPDLDDPAAQQARIEARDRMMREWAEQDRKSGPPSDERPPTDTP